MVTTDNFFTSLQLAKWLKQQDNKIVGTINQIRKEIPKEIKTKKEDLHSIKVFKLDWCSFIVYQGKKNRNVFLLSTMHPAVILPQNLESTLPTKWWVIVL